MYITESAKIKTEKWVRRGFTALIIAVASVCFACVVYFIFKLCSESGVDGLFENLGSALGYMGENAKYKFGYVFSENSLFSGLGENVTAKSDGFSEAFTALGTYISARADAVSAVIAEFFARIAANF